MCDGRMTGSAEELVITHSILYFVLCEDGDCDVCQNNGTAATYDAAEP
jgi:hypothetical protein